MLLNRLARVTAVLVALNTAACGHSDTTQTPTPGTPAPGTPARGAPAAGSGAPGTPTSPTPPPTTPTAAAPSSVLTAAPAVMTGCPATDAPAAAAPGTVHRRAIGGNETWTVAASPHRFPDGFEIKANATVTIEPCALLIMGDGQNGWVAEGATLVAAGEADRPIKFDSTAATPTKGVWTAIHFATGARPASRLAYVVIEDAGQQEYDPAAIVLDAGFVLDAQHVTIRGAKRYGVALANTARFAPTSTDLTVTDSGIAEEQSAAVWFKSPSSVGSLPDGHYTGNATDAILVEGGAVTANATWRNPGVPYRILDDVDVQSETGAILTIAPGTTLAFAQGKGLSVGHSEDGAIVLDGQNEQGRITLTSARPVPDAGDWAGLRLGERLSRAATKLSFVTFQYTGASGGYDAGGCSETHPSAIQIAGRDLGPKIDHVTFRNLDPASYAIVRNFRAAAPTSYVAAALGNDFTGYGGRCRETIARPEDNNCPDPVPPCN